MDRVQAIGYCKTASCVYYTPTQASPLITSEMLFKVAKFESSDSNVRKRLFETALKRDSFSLDVWQLRRPDLHSVVTTVMLYISSAGCHTLNEKEDDCYLSRFIIDGVSDEENRH